MPPTDSSLKNGAGNLAWYFWKIANPRAWPVDVEISFVVRIPLTDQATNGNSFSAMVSTNLIYSFLMSGFCSKWKIKDKLPIEFFPLTLEAQIKTKENKTLREHTARLVSQVPPQPVAVSRTRKCFAQQGETLLPTTSAFSKSRPQMLPKSGKGSESCYPNRGLLWKQRWPTPFPLWAIFEQEARWETWIGIFWSRNYSLGPRGFRRCSIIYFLSLRIIQQMTLFCAQRWKR